MRVLSEIKNRGTQDCLIVVCDGLKGLPEAIAAVWPQTIVQTCVIRPPGYADIGPKALVVIGARGDEVGIITDPPGEGWADRTCSNGCSMMRR
jgi:hypothetical protein